MIAANSISSDSASPASFAAVFGGRPEIAARSPGRINVIGEHVDYQEGLVLPAAIDRYVFAHARRIDAPQLRLWSAEIGGRPVTVGIGHSEPLTGSDFWANYVFGVFAQYRDAGHPVGGLEITFEATLPAGAGMSSSAAIEAATALAVETAGGFSLPARDRALLCQRADHDYVGVPCGIMDQLAVNSGVAGHLLEIDCRSLGVTPTSLPDGLSLVAVDSKVKHTLADGEYGKRRADCEAAAGQLGLPTLRDATLAQIDAAAAALGGRVARRARHVVREIARVREFIAALQAGNAGDAGQRMFDSHASLRDDYEVSCDELDQLVAIAASHGALGSRLMGGGFGGSTINLVRSAEADAFAADVIADYAECCGIEGSAFVVHPVAGAGAQKEVAS